MSYKMKIVKMQKRKIHYKDSLKLFLRKIHYKNISRHRYIGA